MWVMRRHYAQAFPASSSSGIALDDDISSSSSVANDDITFSSIASDDFASNATGFSGGASPWNVSSSCDDIEGIASSTVDSIAFHEIALVNIASNDTTLTGIASNYALDGTASNDIASLVPFVCTTQAPTTSSISQRRRSESWKSFG